MSIQEIVDNIQKSLAEFLREHPKLQAQREDSDGMYYVGETYVYKHLYKTGEFIRCGLDDTPDLDMTDKSNKTLEERTTPKYKL